jgi:hypothetical protein
MSLSIAVKQSPFEYYSFVRITQDYLGKGDIVRLAQASREYYDWAKITALIWRRFSEQEWVPTVIHAEPQPDDAYSDYMTLGPLRMISKVFYDQYLGEMIEALPPISENALNRLKDVNPYDKENRTLRDTFKVLVDPTKFRRTDQVALLQGLLENSLLDNKGALIIPLSLKNLKVLCEHPLRGAENGPVFRKFSELVLDQCNVCPDKINVSFISDRAVEETRHKIYRAQEGQLRVLGFNVASLRHCILRNAASILSSGTCADDSGIYAANPDIVLDGRVRHANVGGCFPHAIRSDDGSSEDEDPYCAFGLEVHFYHPEVVDVDNVVVPSIPAGV